MTFRQTIAAFLGGISQQSRAIRPTNLVDDSVNMEYLPSEGATKRYPTEWRADLDELMSSPEVRVFPMPRDDQDFLVVFDGVSIRVFDADGAEQTVSFQNGATLDYLNGAKYLDLRVQQIADTMYISNRQKVVAGLPGKTYQTWREDFDFGMFVRQSNYGVDYKLKVDTATTTQTYEVSAQDEANFLTGRGFQSSPTSDSAQCYRITSNEASGIDPLFVDDFQYSCRGNSVEDYEVVIIPRSRIVFTGSTVTASVDLAMNGEPTSGQPTFGQWNYDGSRGYPRQPLQYFDKDFQALYLEAGTYTAGDWLVVARKSVTNQSQLSPTYIARQFASLLQADSYLIEPAGYAGPSKEQFNSSFRVYDQTSTVTTLLEFTNTEQEDYCLAWRDSVEDITDLPVFYKHGAVVRVANAPDSGKDDYYVEFATSAWRDASDSDESVFDTYGFRFGRGNWRETAARGESTGSLDNSTMPHRLERNEFGNWSYRRVDWEQRTAGDELTSPEPSFVGSRIVDLFFYENRLGFASDANIILSESAEPESFFRTTVLSLPSSDVIDVGLSSLDGDTVYNVLPYAQRLFAFSETKQAAITSQGALSPSTIESKVVGGFRTSPSVRPVVQGNSLFAPYKTGENFQVREIAPGTYEGDLVDGDPTLAVPRLLPSNVKKVQASSGGNDILLIDDDGGLYLYQYLRSGEQTYMSAWGRWELTGGTVLDFATLRDEVYFFVNRGAKTRIERVSIGSGRGDIRNDFKPRMDSLSSVIDLAGRYDFATDVTTVPVPFEFDADDILQVTATGTGVLEDGAPIPVVSQDAVAGTVSLSGDLSLQSVYVGRRFDCFMTMSDPQAQTPRQGGATAIVGGNTLVRDIVLSLADTGYLKAVVNAVGYGETTEEFLADRMDVGEAIPGVLSSREWMIPVHASSDEFTLKLSNDTPMPSTVVSGGWALRFSSRYRQV